MGYIKYNRTFEIYCVAILKKRTFTRFVVTIFVPFCIIVCGNP